VSRRLRRLYHWFSRAEKGSKRRGKLLVKIRREFEYENNVKRDKVNKVAHYVTSNYVVFQLTTYTHGRSCSVGGFLSPLWGDCATL